MDEPRGTPKEECLRWILMVSGSPAAILIFMLMALLSLLRFLFKASLLFIIVSINTPFAMMYNVSILVFQFDFVRFWESSADSWNWSDPRANVGIEVQIIVSNFLKVVGGQLLLVLSTGVITFYTAPIQVFYISMAVGVTAIVLKWLNTNSLSKTAFSCLCDGCGLTPMMFLFSFIGLFDIGCHPIAKCSFVASKAVLFLKNGAKQGNEEDELFLFNEDMINSENTSIEFFKWNAFERGLFQLSPRIDFIKRDDEKYILKSFMVLKLYGMTLCEYPVERLELPEVYSKIKELCNFLVTLSDNDAFVTDKMRGRYEHTFTLSEIVDGVQENKGYTFVDPKDKRFVVASSTNDNCKH